MNRIKCENFKCENCGAPMRYGRVAKCEYCGSEYRLYEGPEIEYLPPWPSAMSPHPMLATMSSEYGTYESISTSLALTEWLSGY